MADLSRPVALDGPATPTYGPESARAFSKLWTAVSHVQADIVDQAIRELCLTPKFGEFWGHLGPAERAEFLDLQARHLAYVISPEADEDTHRDRAVRLGHIHELSGFDLTLVSKLYKIAFKRLLALAQDTIGNEREVLDICLAHRLMIDVTCQAKSHYDYQAMISNLFIRVDQVIAESSNLPDLLQNLMDTLNSVDGICATLFSRADHLGLMQIEAFGGELGRKYAHALIVGGAPMFSTVADSEGGAGPAGRAWRSREIQVSTSNFSDPTVKAWRSIRETLNFRSSAAVPLLEEDGEPFAILSLYSNVIGYFSAANRLQMLRYIQQAASHSIRPSQSTRVISHIHRRYYLDRISTGTVEMLYQPIIDLKHRRISHIEALARLRGPDGQMIAPGEFLPALGSAGLRQLFRIGLETGCRDLRGFQSDSKLKDLKLSINMPTEGLNDDSYKDILFETAALSGIGFNDLMIEILESKDPQDQSKSDRLLDAFQRAGVGIVQDDLGSGHSSLLRLDRIPFDGVKIDQGLVRRASTRPWRALEFVYHLTSLAQGMQVPVTVEGLENRGLVEASTILGADCGQGFEIARPMPAGDFVTWAAGWSMDSVHRHRPRTMLGVMASVLLWERAIKSARHQAPDQVPQTFELLIDFGDLDATDIDKAKLEQHLRALERAARSNIGHDDYRQARQAVADILSEA